MRFILVFIFKAQISKVIWLLNLLVTFALDLFSKQGKIGTGETILVYRNDGLGDFFLTLPAIRLLLGVGGVRFMCKDSYHNLLNLDGLMYVSADIVCSRKIITLYSILRRCNHVVMFRDNHLLHLTSLLAGCCIHTRANFRRLLSTPERRRMCESASHLRQVEKACDFSDSFSCLGSNFDYNVVYMDQFSRYNKILVVPGAQNPLRQPSIEGLSELCKLFAHDHVQFRIIRYQEPRKYIDTLTESLNGDISIKVIQNLSQDEYVGQFRWPQLVISADSSAQHIASYFDIPSIVLFGPNRPLVWGPWASSSRSAVIQNVNCPFYPCDQKRCYIKRPCIGNIQAEFIKNCIIDQKGVKSISQRKR